MLAESLRANNPIQSGAVRWLPVTRAATALAAALLGLAAGAFAQEALIGGAGATSGEIQAKLEELSQQIARLDARAAEWQAKTAEYEQARRDAPAEVAEIDAEITRLQRPLDVAISAAATQDQLEVLVLGAEQDLTLAQREATELAAEQDGRSERRRQLPELLAQAKSQLAALPAAPPPSAGEEAVVTEAHQRLAEKRRAALESEVRAHEQELLSYEARGVLLEKRIARANLRVAREQQRLEQLRQAFAERRERVATDAAQRAMASIEEAASLAPAAREVVSRLAQQNAELARVRTGENGLLQAIDDVSRKLANADQRLGEIDADFQRLSQKVASGGLTDTVGILLRRMRSQAPDVGKYRRFIRIRQQEIAAVQARQEELRDELASMSDTDAVVAATIAEFAAAVPETDRAQLEALLRDLLETKLEHLAALLGDYELYFQKLVDFDARQQELIEKTENLLLFIDQRILWIPSSGAVRVKIASDGLEALTWLATPQHWARLGRALVAALSDAALMSFCVAVLFVCSLLLRRSMKRQLRELAVQARQPTQTAVAPTVEALGLSLALAPWVAALMIYLGWRLSVSPEATQYVRSAAHGLVGAGTIWLTLAVPRQLVRRDGIADAHFAWPQQAVAALHREIGWITALAVPLVFLIQFFEMRGEEAWRESVGRVSLIALLVAVTVFTHRVLGEGGAVRAILRASQSLGIKPWAWRVVHATSLAVPLALAIAAARGYYWTALQLGASYHQTLVYLFVLLAALHLALRWSLMARRRLAFDQWRAEREAEQTERVRPEQTEERSVIPEPELDLGTVDVQTGRLLSTSAVVAMLLGLWFLWADLVPALGVLDGVELWTTTETHTVEMTAADGSRALHSEARVVPITLASLLAAVLVAFMTFVLVRNLPGLLEISLFRQLGTGPGERYAIASLAKYAIAIVGGVLAFRTLGLGWSNVQWLVAAVGLGLGFGLQEIFANFVSGLIILFERPIRVGDTVTVGNVSGTVSKIRIRATWITAFDRKELVVPNKEFVTNQLVNWSLSDRVLRVDIRVSIASGVDLEKAMRELLAVAQANEYVLTDPRPRVVFLRFGENGLDLELRVFSPDVDHTLLIQHELHLAVDRAFREAEIAMASPQRDLRIRSVPPEWSRSDASD